MTLSRTERVALGILLVIFTCFTWRGMTMFYSGDDMMNLSFAWFTRPWRLIASQLAVWIPVYRPLGAGVYRLFYRFWGYHAAPLYVFCWLLLTANVWFAYRFFKVVARTTFEALVALSIVLVHGSFTDLYYNAGTIYDRLCFLFTVIGLTAYFRFRSRPGWRSLGLVCLFSILCMDSKESGVTLPALMFCCECIYFLPELWNANREPRDFLRAWLRQVGPLFATLAIVCLIFVFGRVNRTPELMSNGAYRPHASAGAWLTHVAEYLTILTYNHLTLSAVAALVLLAVMWLAAALLRNRPMIFGWLFFVTTITPVALISSRPGYVLYVPELGLGLYFASALGLLFARLGPSMPRAAIAALAVTIAAITWFHVRNWPAGFNRDSSAELRLMEQFERDFPILPRGCRFLFVSDGFPRTGFDLMFTLRLIYHDKTIVVDRLNAPPDQQPKPGVPLTYDHIMAWEGGEYVELDPRNPDESIRLNVLRYYTVGREMDMMNRDRSAYVVSGLQDDERRGASRWMAPCAEFKFDLFPAPVIFSTLFWVTDEIAKSGNKTLSILVNKTRLSTLRLTKEGSNEISFPVPANLITRNGYTLVDMNVTNPFKDKNGIEHGVVMLRAGFEYQPE